jgi:hypothetical protein
MDMDCVADLADTAALLESPYVIHGPTKRRAIAVEAKLPAAPAPCVGCRHEPRCALEQLGCDALVLFKRVTTSPERLAIAPRQPTRELYERANAPKVKRPAPPVSRPPVLDEDEAD